MKRIAIQTKLQFLLSNRIHDDRRILKWPKVRRFRVRLIRVIPWSDHVLVYTTMRRIFCRPGETPSSPFKDSGTRTGTRQTSWLSSKLISQSLFQQRLHSGWTAFGPSARTLRFGRGTWWCFFRRIRSVSLSRQNNNFLFFPNLTDP